MKAIEELKRKLAAVGATLDENYSYDLNCDAPSGYVWAANGCRCLCIQWATNSQTWLIKALKEAQADFEMGLVKVTDPEAIASHRWDMDDDTWGAPADAPNKIEWPS